jgi:hypothetical protein
MLTIAALTPAVRNAAQAPRILRVAAGLSLPMPRSARMSSPIALP